jgi:hypothetical protein
MKNQTTENQNDDGKVLGDINPRREHSNKAGSVRHTANDADREDETTMEPGPNQGNPKHSGSRDVSHTAGASETGGSRNFRSTGGATGSDLGNRPE